MKLEVGKTSGCAESGSPSVTVLKRTSRTVTVTNGSHVWRMLIRIDQDGNEYTVDSSVPPNWRDSYRWSAKWEETD